MKLNHEQLQHVFRLQENYMADNPQLREGQAFFNALHWVAPACANEVRDTDLDPYHDSSRINSCVDYIVEI